MIICLNTFPPSTKFTYYLQGYIGKQVTGKVSDELRAHTEHAYKKLERIAKAGAKRGNQAPTLEEIEHARV